MNSRAALILAGGKAERFQTPNQPWQDKALVQVDGKPLLVKAVQNVQGIVDTVAVCVNNNERKTFYSQVLQQHGVENVKFVVDRADCPVKGPALAIMSGLHAVSSAHCLTLPVDMPFVKPEVADYMFTAAEGFDVAVPMWPDGTLETLVMALDRQNTLEIAQTLCMLSKPRANNIARGASKLLLVSPLQEIKLLDPQLKSFANINTQEDLTQIPARHTEGEVKENHCINRGVQPISEVRLLRDGAKLFGEGDFLKAQKIFNECQNSFGEHNNHFWVALSAEKKAEALRERDKQFSSNAKEAFAEAAVSYGAEAEEYAAKGCRRLAECALADKEICQSQAID
jgi:molybdopterin-guanine dinucleotide biosynthesis protein A